MKRSRNHLVWLDCEMTGLDPAVHAILEIGVVITDSELNVVAEGPAIAVRRTERELAVMDAWNRRHHARSGLLDLVRASKTTTARAETEALNFVKKYCYKGASPLCGNSVGHDRAFLAKHMTALNGFFHYQIVDVSTIKQLVNRWYARRLRYPPKKSLHRAIPDIMESISELRFYRERVFP